mmetsp:Transcript_134814/g.319560  ORF Transcript_134814/g.319560 Transcript_134814/m.319560 type:complete len:243 (+) Transcript_134814:355-1083(+)
MPQLAEVARVAVFHHHCSQSSAVVAAYGDAGTNRLQPKLAAAGLVVLEACAIACRHGALPLAVLLGFCRSHLEVRRFVVTWGFSATHAVGAPVHFLEDCQRGILQRGCVALEVAGDHSGLHSFGPDLTTPHLRVELDAHAGGPLAAVALARLQIVHSQKRDVIRTVIVAPVGASASNALTATDRREGELCLTDAARMWGHEAFPEAVPELLETLVVEPGLKVIADVAGAHLKTAPGVAILGR